MANEKHNSVMIFMGEIGTTEMSGKFDRTSVSSMVSR